MAKFFEIELPGETTIEIPKDFELEDEYEDDDDYDEDDDDDDDDDDDYDEDDDDDDDYDEDDDEDEDDDDDDDDDEDEDTLTYVNDDGWSIAIGSEEDEGESLKEIGKNILEIYEDDEDCEVDSHEITNIGGKKVFVIYATILSDDEDEDDQSVAVYVFKLNGFCHVITCSCPASDFEDAEEVFEAVVSSAE